MGGVSKITPKIISQLSLKPRERSIMGGVMIAQAGGRVEGYDEKLVAEHLKGQEVGIEVNLGVGRSKARVWTCDFTHDYITINAEYRT